MIDSYFLEHIELRASGVSKQELTTMRKKINNNENPVVLHVLCE